MPFETYEHVTMSNVIPAETARDLQVIRSLEFLTSYEQKRLLKRTIRSFQNTAASILPDVEAFETENYRRLKPADQTVVFEGVQELLCRCLPSWIS